MNNTARVNDDKRQRVEEAVDTLGYTPNPLALGLLKKETGGLGIILPFVSGEYFSEFLRGIDLRTQEEGYFLTIATSHRSMAEMQGALNSFRHRVDGLILMAPDFDAEGLLESLNTGLPMVLVNSTSKEVSLDVINLENREGAFLAVEHLIALGHKRIAILKGPSEAHDANMRLKGYLEALASHGLERNQHWELEGDFTPEAGYAAASKLLAITPRPTAIFCANDQSAMALMAALQKEGIRIPQDISVVGFDNVPSALYTSPALTSVAVPIREMGTAAIERLLHLIKHPDAAPLKQVLPVELIARESSGPLS